MKPETVVELGPQCPVCRNRVGNLAKHEPTCRRDRALIERAGAHAVDEANLHPMARLQNGVDDLAVARVLWALETGARIWPQGRGWRAHDGSSLNHQRLTATVQEMIRLGLAHQHSEPTGPATRVTYLVPAITHLRNGNLPACRTMTTYRRFRLLDDPALVDCQVCKDRA